MKDELHPSKNRLLSGLAMDDRLELIGLFSGVATPRDSNAHAMYLPRVCLTIYTLRKTIIPLVRGIGSPSRTNSLRG